VSLFIWLPVCLSLNVFVSVSVSVSNFRKKIKLKKLKKGNYVLKIKLKDGEVIVNNFLN